MRITVVTDLPVWVRPLVGTLEAAGAEVEVATRPEDVPGDGLILNRLSTLMARRTPERVAGFEAAFLRWECEGRRVVNGARCFRLGLDKLAQAEHFRASGVRTPRTAPAVPGGRALPGRAVLLKPPAGGFGKGIRELAPDELAPADLFTADEGWIEQERHASADHAVHRVEFAGRRILYDAKSPLRPGEFNYCLAGGDAEVFLTGEEEMRGEIADAARRVADRAGMELGALEYLADPEGGPVFIDLNPVSSLHPDAARVLGEKPVDAIADHLMRRAASGG